MTTTPTPAYYSERDSFGLVLYHYGVHLMWWSRSDRDLRSWVDVPWNSSERKMDALDAVEFV